MLRLTKRYPFSASHRLHSDQLSDEENARLFGKCNYPFGHGHNYTLEVRLAGEAEPRSGMLVPRGALDDFVKKTVLSRVDHANLNNDLPEFRQTVPTTENLALLIWCWLHEGWGQAFSGQSVRLAGIRIEETGRNSFEITN